MTEENWGPEAIIRTIASEQPGCHVLDLGCGNGRHAIYLAQHGFRVTAVDKSTDRLDELTEKARREDVRPRITPVHAEAREVLRPDKGWDIVIIDRILHNLSRRDALLLLSETQAHTEKNGLNAVLAWLDIGNFPRAQRDEKPDAFFPTERTMEERYRLWERLGGGIRPGRATPHPHRKNRPQGRIWSGLYKKP